MNNSIKDTVYAQTMQAMNTGYVTVLVWHDKPVSAGTYRNGVKVA